MYAAPIATAAASTTTTTTRVASSSPTSRRAFAPRLRARGVAVAVAATPSPSRRSSTTSDRTRHVVVASATRGGKGRVRDDGSVDTSGFSNETKMRSEAQAPFRTARMFLFGAFAANATLGLGIATLQAVTKALGAPSAPPLEDSLQNMGVDLLCAAFFAFFYKKDAEGRDKQMARISREERLGALKCQLGGGSGKRVSMAQLRGFSRVVIAAGSAEHCVESVNAAEAHREELTRRGVLLLPVVTSGDASILPPPSEDDRRFRAAPIKARSSIITLLWSPYDRVRVVNADP